MSRGKPEPAGASALEAELRALHQRIKGRFARPVAWERALAYLKGLLAPVERKNGWQLAEHAGDARPDGVQRLLSTYRWDEDGVRDDLREYVVEQLGDERAVLVVTETGFLKQGRRSAGVERQYNRTAGKVERCQVGVFLGYSSRRGRAIVDRELYLAEDWQWEWDRREAAGVPDELPVLQEKADLAKAMIERALEAGVSCAWVVADAACCNDSSMRWWLEKQGVGYVMAVPDSERLLARGTDGVEFFPAHQLAEKIPDADWRRINGGETGQGPRPYEWARVALRAREYPQGWHWLLARRSVADPTDVAYYDCLSRAEVSLDELTRVAGHGLIIDDTIMEARREVGLDQYEVRRWSGWYRHITLALAAHACAAVAHQAVARRVSKGDRRRSSS